MAERARDGQATWGDRIVHTLGEGKATTRMLAQKLGCQTGDISRAIEGLRQAGMIIDAGTGLDPQTNCKAHFWALEPELAGFVDTI
jgi:hypothetical protein